MTQVPADTPDTSPLLASTVQMAGVALPYTTANPDVAVAVTVAVPPTTSAGAVANATDCALPSDTGSPWPGPPPPHPTKAVVRDTHSAAACSREAKEV